MINSGSFASAVFAIFVVLNIATAQVPEPSLEDHVGTCEQFNRVKGLRPKLGFKPGAQGGTEATFDSEKPIYEVVTLSPRRGCLCQCGSVFIPPNVPDSCQQCAASGCTQPVDISFICRRAVYNTQSGKITVAQKIYRLNWKPSHPISKQCQEEKEAWEEEVINHELNHVVSNEMVADDQTRELRLALVKLNQRPDSEAAYCYKTDEEIREAIVLESSGVVNSAEAAAEADGIAKGAAFDAHYKGKPITCSPCKKIIKPKRKTAKKSKKKN